MDDKCILESYGESSEDLYRSGKTNLQKEETRSEYISFRFQQYVLHTKVPLRINGQ